MSVVSHLPRLKWGSDKPMGRVSETGTSRETESIRWADEPCSVSADASSARDDDGDEDDDDDDDDALAAAAVLAAGEGERKPDAGELPDASSRSFFDMPPSTSSVGVVQYGSALLASFSVSIIGTFSRRFFEWV